ncbi:MAG: hypothetical protein AB7F59_15305 [Bdellovibrionales bacterium]
MVHSFEFRLHKLFVEHSDALRVADQVLKDWNNGQLSWRDQESAGFFLIQTGFYRALFEQILKLSKNRQRIPWGSFAEALGRLKVTLTKEDIDDLLLGAAEEEALPSLVRSWALDSLDPRFAKIRTSLNNSGELSKSRSQPKKSPRVENSSITRQFRRNESSEERERIAQLFLEKAKQTPQQAYEMAVSLYLMGLSEEALLLLPLCQPEDSLAWFEIELLIECKKYLEALEKIEYLEKTVKDFTIIEVPVLYLKAFVAKGLKQHALALELIKKVVHLQPDYKSASSILYDWKELSK